ncbi:Dynamitin-domain-containing protein [Xylariaceae sp. FL0594]|nr:Dynamitin-domain-containing protein [Xylariaceae sp. FL0594]
MAVNRKYAELPDLDSAPDIYETPELTDDNSTVPPTIERSPSDDEFDEGDGYDNGEDTGISRSRLRIDNARSRFLPAQVDARDVDFSDRLSGKRKSYRASSRRQQSLKDGSIEIGDLSDDEAGKTLEGKLARLKREILEAKEEYGRQKEKSAETSSTEQDDELLALSQAVEELSTQADEARRSRPRATRPPLDLPQDEQDNSPLSAGNATYTVTYAPDYEQTHALARAATFDWRLSLLEKTIGVSSAPDLERSGLPRAILPTLETLQNQIMTLSEASTSSLDSISRRVRTLTQEAEQLENSRKAAKMAQEELSSTGGSTVEADDTEQTAKINALYGMLPTIENLMPILPHVLDRLRSLRSIHADAATATDTLERIEHAQRDMAEDIKQWREGLEKIEESMKEGETAMSGNMKVVEGWVKELESKMARLS